MAIFLKSFRKFFERKKRPARREDWFRPTLEPLEERVLMAGNSDRFGVPGGGALSLASWIRTETGGIGAGRGSVSISGTTATLREGNSFYVSLKRDFTVPSAASNFSFTFTNINPNPANKGMQDAFEVAFVDTNGNPLTPTVGPGRDAFFSKTKGETPMRAAGATQTSQTVTMSLGGIAPGTKGTLIFRLVTNDDIDNDTNVTISNVRLTATPSAKPPSGVPGTSVAPPRQNVDFDLLSDVTPSFAPKYGKAAWDESTSMLFTDLSLRNIGNYAVHTPLLIGIRNMSDPNVIVQDPDGVTPEGVPYFDVSNLVAGPTLQPGKSTGARTLAFFDPNRGHFKYELVVLGLLNHTPSFTSAPVAEGVPGRTYVYDANATDPDADDVLRYVIITGPVGMTIDQNSGVVNWSPQVGDVGNHQITLRVDDQKGASSTQTFTLAVAPAPPNRPPLFTSTPIVDGEVAASFERVDIPVGNHPLGVALGNFTGSGDLSVVTANELDYTVSVAPGHGDGTFDPRTDFGTGWPKPVSNQLFVMPETLPLTFPPPNLNSSGVFGVAKGDFNRDGNLDVALTVFREVPFSRTYWLTIMLGNGDGTFQEPVDVAQFPVNAYGILAKDFSDHNDGTLDLVVTVNERSEVWFFKGQGNGAFDAPVILDAGNKPSFVQAADLNHDNRLDIVSVNFNPNTVASSVSVFLNAGGGTFNTATQYATDRNPQDVAIADINNDGNLDLITPNYGFFSGPSLTLWTNDGAGQFVNRQDVWYTHPFGGLSSPSAIFAGNFFGHTDATIDLVLATSAGLERLRGDGAGNFTVMSDGNPVYAPRYPIVYQPVRYFVENDTPDLNADGKPDIFFGYWGRGSPNVVTVGFSTGDTDGTFNFKQFVASAGAGVPNTTLAGEYPGSVITGDFNNDGVQDLVVGGINDFNPRRPGGVSLLLGRAPGDFAAPRDYLMPREVAADSGYFGGRGLTAIGDFTEDGVPDAVILTSSLSFAPGLGDGSFGPGVAVLPRIAGGAGREIRAADFNRDGYLDVAWQASQCIVVALGNGAGAFSVLQSLPMQGFPNAPFGDFYNSSQNLQVGDLNGDGHPDLVGRTWNAGSLHGNVEIWLYDVNANGGIGGFNYIPDAGLQMYLGRTPDDTIQHENGSNILLGDFNNDSILDLIVHAGPLSTPGNPAFVPERLYFWKGKASATAADASDLFEAPVNVNPNPPIEARAGNGTASFWASTAGDFNHDGNLDLAGVGAFATFTLLGNGDGTFQGAKRYEYGNWDVVSADLDRDGNIDLVVNSGGFGPNAVRRGRGDGTFGPLEFVADPQHRGDGIVLHDLNGDGRLDMVETDQGNDAGAYKRITAWLQPLPGLQDVEVGNVRDLGFNDIVTVDQANDRLKVLAGDGTGAFERLHDVIVGRGPVAVALGHLNSDGKLDAVTANQLGNSVSVLLSQGGGVFTRTDLTVGTRPSDVAVGDLNGDNRTDIIVANREDNTVMVLLGNGDGTFQPAQMFAVGSKPSSVAVTDVNGDGRPDLVTANQGNNSVSVLLGRGDGTFEAAVGFFAGTNPACVAAGDVNGDGRADLVVTNPDDDRVSLLLNQGNAEFANPILLRVGKHPTAIRLADVNHDGKLDIATANAEGDSATVLLNHFGIGAPYRYQVTTSDPDGDSVSVTVESGPAGLTISRTGLVTWFPTTEQMGPNPVTLQANDGNGGVSTQTFIINIRQTLGNHPPVIVSEPITTAAIDLAYAYQARAVDGDNDAPQFSLSTAPDGMAIDFQTGAIAWDPRGSALSFDGTDRVVIPDAPSVRPTSLTLEGWFKFDGTNTAILVQKSNDGWFFRASYQLWYDAPSQTLNAGIGRNDNAGLDIVSAPFAPVLGRWYHLAFTFDDPSKNKVLYVDGNAVSSSVGTRSIEYTADPIVLGHQAPDYHTNYFRGTMDEIRVWDHARSLGQIQADLGRKLAGNEPGLAALYRLDEGQGTKILDATGNHNDGTLGDSGIGTRVPTWVNGMSPLGTFPVVVRVDDGKGGFSTQSFDITITNEAPAAISGTVFNDVVNTPGLAGWVVFLDQNQNGIRDSGERFVTTGADGLYSFTDLTPGTYRVVVEGQSGWSPTVPAGGVASIVTAPGQGFAQLDQFASSVIAFSSQYSSPSYGAIQALGAPNVFAYGDNPNAWTISSQNSGTHFLTLGYATPVFADGVTVRETLSNGFVTQIDVVDMNDTLHTVWTGVDPSLPSTVADFRINFARTNFLVKGVKVYVDTNRDGGYEEIDAVTLHGLDPAQMNNFGMKTTSVTEPRPLRIINAPPDTAVVGAVYRYQPLVENPDGRPVVFDLVVKPEGMAIDPITGVTAWIPQPRQGGATFPMAIAIRDAYTGTLIQVEIKVELPNTPPIIISTPPGPAGPGLPYSYRVVAQDANADPLSFSLDANSQALGMTIDAAGVLRWIPTAGDVGPTHTVVVTVMDSHGAADTQTFNLPVVAGPPNNVPVITSMPRTVIGLGNTYFYDVMVADPDGDPLTFDLPTRPAGMTIDANGRITWTLPAALGPNVVTVSVTDGRSPAVTQNFTITVVSQNPNRAPDFTSQPATIATAGEEYAYDVIASDPDGDPMAFSFDQAPAGMSINPATGTIRWTPTLDQFGANTVTVRVIDAQGATAAQTFVITVRGAHVPPVIRSAPPTSGSVGSTYLYQLAVIAPPGTVLGYSLTTFPTGMTIDPQTGLIAWTPGVAVPEDVTVQVDDGHGGTATQQFTILVAASAPNLPPVITSAPPLSGAASTPYTYTIQSIDPDNGPSPLNFALLDGPAGITVNANSGLVQWTPTAAQVGTHTITVAAFDGPNATGGAALQTFNVRVLAFNHAPTINSPAPIRVTAGTLYRYDVNASDIDGDSLSYTLTSAPAGMTIDSGGRVRWQTAVEPNSTPPVVSAVTIEVRDPRGAVATQSFNLTLQADQFAPLVGLALVRRQFNLGDTALARVVASDNVGLTSLVLTVNGTPVALDANGGAVLDTSATGVLNLVATATDAAGNIGTMNTTVLVVDPNVLNAPTIAITTPPEGGVVTTFTDVIGTVTDPNPGVRYQLFLKVADAPDSAFKQIGGGTGNVVNSRLGVIDPTLLTNDNYVLRLTAINAAGRQEILDQNIGISGDLKLGNFHLAFEDMTVDVGGVSIALIRTYDTLHSARKDDFGFGWRLEFRDTDLRTNLPNEGQPIVGLYTPFTFGTKVYLTLPGGKREGFTFTPDIHSLFSLTYFTPRFTPDSGVTDQMIVPNVFLIQGADGNFYTLNGQLPYNPASPDFGGSYTVKTKEGITYQINGGTGLLDTITDRNNNKLTFDDAGITSSAGPQIRFERDGQNRIAAAIDPSGKKIKYAYSAAGDLTSVTDRLGNVTQFTYDPARAHYLSRVIDPLGRAGIRTAYNAEGRLTRTLDANGKAVEFSYDPTHSLQTVKDALGNQTSFEYDAFGNVVTTIDALGEISRRTYDANNNETSFTDPLGHVTTRTFDAAGNMLSVTDPSGRKTFLTYNLFNQQTTLTDPLGRTSRINYDSTGNVTSFTGPDGQTVRLTLDTAGRPTTLTDLVGNVTQLTFNSLNLESAIADPSGITTAITYDTHGRAQISALTFTSNHGPVTLTTTNDYDASGHTIRTTDAAGNVTQRQFDAMGNNTRIIDGLGRAIAYQYDALNRPVKATNPDGTTQFIAYDAGGRIISTTDRAGRVTQYLYDALGRLTDTIYPDATRRHTDYDAAGRIIRQTDELLRETQFFYDAADRLIRTRNAAGKDTTYTYDAVGRKITETDPLGHTTRYVYDDGDRVVQVIFADGTRILNVYDARGLKIATTDQGGMTTRYQYDNLRRLIAVIEPLGSTTTYTYDQRGNLLTKTDANNHTTTFEYDDLGRNVAKVLPLGPRSTTTYDAMGRVISETDFNGNTIRYQYDALDRVIAETPPTGTPIRYTYTATGQVSTITDANGVTRFVYDLRDRITQRTDPDGSRIAYVYDAVGNVILMTASTAVTSIRTTYTFDAMNRMATVTDSSGGVTRYTYDDAGNLILTERPNGTTEARQYDLLNRVVFVQNTGPAAAFLSSYTYTLDANGLVIQNVENSGGNIRTVTYSYDLNHRLVQEAIVDAIAGNRTITYMLDSVGNRLSYMDSVEGTTTYIYDANDRLTQSTLGGNVTNFAYDNNGNMLSAADADGNVTAYSWDFFNRLTRVQTSGPVLGNHVTKYLYNAAGIRIAQTVDGQTTRFLNSDSRLARVVLEYSPGGVITASYTFGQELISRLAGGVRVHYGHDAHSGVRFLTSPAGVVVANYTYDAYGRSLVFTGGSDNPFLYRSEPIDPLTRLQYLRARHYDPVTGRFLSQDPFQGSIEFPVTQHRYLYGNADPVNHSDPSGELSVAEFLVGFVISGLLCAAQMTATYYGYHTAANIIGLVNLTLLLAPIVYGVGSVAVAIRGSYLAGEELIANLAARETALLATQNAAAEEFLLVAQEQIAQKGARKLLNNLIVRYAKLTPAQLEEVAIPLAVNIAENAAKNEAGRAASAAAVNLLREIAATEMNAAKNAVYRRMIQIIENGAKPGLPGPGVPGGAF